MCALFAVLLLTQLDVQGSWVHARVLLRRRLRSPVLHGRPGESRDWKNRAHRCHHHEARQSKAQIARGSHGRRGTVVAVRSVRPAQHLHKPSLSFSH